MSYAVLLHAKTSLGKGILQRHQLADWYFPLLSGEMANQLIWPHLVTSITS